MATTVGVSGAAQAAPDLALDERLKLFLKTIEWTGSDGKVRPHPVPIPVSVGWGKIMSAVLVGNLLAAVIAGIFYAIATAR